jgi:hypothetical protein
MKDNQIEVLSKAIDSMLQIRKRLGLIGREPQGNDDQELKRAVVNVSNARYLLACMERGEDWQP